MAVALKSILILKVYIFTAKEQGEQQRAIENIEFQQKGLDLKRIFKKQDKINTAKSVLALAQVIKVLLLKDRKYKQEENN